MENIFCEIICRKISTKTQVLCSKLLFSISHAKIPPIKVDAPVTDIFSRLKKHSASLPVCQSAGLDKYRRFLERDLRIYHIIIFMWSKYDSYIICYSSIYLFPHHQAVSFLLSPSSSPVWPTPLSTSSSSWTLLNLWRWRYCVSALHLARLHFLANNIIINIIIITNFESMMAILCQCAAFGQQWFGNPIWLTPCHHHPSLFSSFIYFFIFDLNVIRWYNCTEPCKILNNTLICANNIKIHISLSPRNWRIPSHLKSKCQFQFWISESS